MKREPRWMPLSAVLRLEPKRGPKLLTRLPPPRFAPPKKTDEEEERTVRLQREHQVDAIIVRVLKARKSIAHADLFAETLRFCRAFVLEPRFFKERVEVLVEREYCERAEGNPNVLNYLA